MKKIIFKGCGTAIVTPFTKDGIDIETFQKIVEFQIKNNADSIIVCGTTGESSTMTTEEKIEVISTAVKISKGKIPIIAGTGSNNTKEVIKMNKIVKEIGVDGVLIVTPYYNKTTQKGLIKHYDEISQNTDLPIILYNVPGRTGLNINPETVYKLAKRENIVAIKEASGNISQVAKIRSLCKNSINIYSGNDDQIIPILSLGGIGVISVLSNISPKYVNNMCNAYFNNKIKEAEKLQIDAIPLIERLFEEVNPIPIKQAMKFIGFDCGEPRLPLIEIDKEKSNKLEEIVQKWQKNTL